MAQPNPFDSKEIKRRMHGAVEALKHDFGGLRTGRAAVSLVDPIHVDAYGASMPLNQVATVTVPEPRMLSIQVWDRGLVIAVEKAIRASNLGLNPQSEGQVIRVPLPPLTQERRNELAKAAARYAEQTRVAIRGVRRDGMEQVKGWDKKHEVSEDDAKRSEDEIQKLTDQYVKQVDAALVEKEKDIRTV